MTGPIIVHRYRARVATQLNGEGKVDLAPANLIGRSLCASVLAAEVLHSLARKDLARHDRRAGSPTALMQVRAPGVVNFRERGTTFAGLALLGLIAILCHRSRL